MAENSALEKLNKKIDGLSIKKETANEIKSEIEKLISSVNTQSADKILEQVNKKLDTIDSNNSSLREYIADFVKTTSETLDKIDVPDSAKIPDKLKEYLLEIVGKIESLKSSLSNPSATVGFDDNQVKNFKQELNFFQNEIESTFSNGLNDVHENISAIIVDIKNKLESFQDSTDKKTYKYLSDILKDIKNSKTDIIDKVSSDIKNLSETNDILHQKSIKQIIESTAFESHNVINELTEFKKVAVKSKELLKSRNEAIETLKTELSVVKNNIIGQVRDVLNKISVQDEIKFLCEDAATEIKKGNSEFGVLRKHLKDLKLGDEKLELRFKEMFGIIEEFKSYDFPESIEKIDMIYDNLSILNNWANSSDGISQGLDDFYQNFELTSDKVDIIYENLTFINEWVKTLDKFAKDIDEIRISCRGEADLPQKIDNIYKNIEAVKEWSKKADALSLQVKALSVQISETETSVNAQNLAEIKRLFDKMNNNVSDMNNGASEVKNKIEGIKNGISDTNNNISNLKNNISDVNTNLLDTKNGVSDINTNVEDIKDTISELKNGVSCVNTNVSDTKNSISDIKNNITDVKNCISDVKNDVSDIVLCFSDIKNGIVDEIGAGIADVKNTVLEFNKDFSDVRTVLSQSNNSITDVKNSISDVNGRISDVNTNISEVNNRISDTNTNISGINSNILDLNHTMCDISDNFSDINQNMSVLNNNITVANNNISDMNNNVSDMNSRTVKMFENSEKSGIILNQHIKNLENVIETFAQKSDANTDTLKDWNSKADELALMVKTLSGYVNTQNFNEFKFLFNSVAGKISEMTDKISDMNTRTNKMIIESDKSNDIFLEYLKDFQALINSFAEKSESFGIENLSQKIDELKVFSVKKSGFENVLTESLINLAEWMDAAGSTINSIKTDIANLAENTDNRFMVMENVVTAPASQNSCIPQILQQLNNIEDKLDVSQKNSPFISQIQQQLNNISEQIGKYSDNDSDNADVLKKLNDIENKFNASKKDSPLIPHILQQLNNISETVSAQTQDEVLQHLQNISEYLERKKVLEKTEKQADFNITKAEYNELKNLLLYIASGVENQAHQTDEISKIDALSERIENLENKISSFEKYMAKLIDYLEED